MDILRNLTAALVLGTAALGAQAGEVTGYEIHTQGGYHSMLAPAGGTAVVRTGSVGQPVSGEVAAGDLGLRAVGGDAHAPAPVSVGRIESQFAVGA